MPPIVIGAGIAAVGAIGAAAISNKGTSKAVAAQQQGNDAALASQERGRAEAAGALAPWQNAGLQANGVLQDALGFTQPQSSAAYGYGVADGQAGMGAPGAGGARSAFDTFLNSTNYNWQLGQGNKALNGGWAGAGTLQSGAAGKAFIDYNQNMARGAFQDWYGSVENIANRGYGAANAQAGVATNTANNVSSLNSSNANALAQLQIAKANNTAGLVGSLGQIGGYVAGNVLRPAPTNLLAGGPYG